MATNREEVTRIRSTSEEKAAWFAAAVRAEAPNVSTWIRFHLNEAAGADLRVAPVVDIGEAIEKTGAVIAADLTAEMQADGTLTGAERVEFATEPILLPTTTLPSREIIAGPPCTCGAGFGGGLCHTIDCVHGRPPPSRLDSLPVLRTREFRGPDPKPAKKPSGRR